MSTHVKAAMLDVRARLARAREALDAVTDPELPFLTIRDLGILRDIRVVDDAVEVVITPTYLGCPAWDVIAYDVDAALARARALEETAARIRAWFASGKLREADAADRLDQIRKRLGAEAPSRPQG